MRHPSSALPVLEGARTLRLTFLVAAVAASLLAVPLAPAGAAPPAAAASSPPSQAEPPSRADSKALLAKLKGTRKARAASCSAPMLGTWRNIDAATRSITRVVVDLFCDDVRLCDEFGNCTGGTGTNYFARPFGKCHPTDCDWGRRRAERMHDGWYRSIHPFGFKTSHVWMQTSTHFGRLYLRVWVYNDFTPQDGRPDYTTDEWFLR